MKLLSSWLNRSFYTNLAIAYIIIYALVASTQTAKVPEAPIVAMQILGLVLVCIFSFVYSKKSILATCVAIFIFQLIASYGYRWFFLDYFNNPLGFHPRDALQYDLNGLRNWRLSFDAFMATLESNDVMLDDQGMNYIVYYTYKLAGGGSRGIHLLVLFNAIAVTVSSYYLFKVMKLDFNQSISNFVAFFWGTELYAAYTAAAGLKENFMVMFLVMAFYYITKIYFTFSIKDFLLAILMSSTTLLFRMALFYMLLMSLAFILALKSGFFRRYLLFFLVIVLIAGISYYYETVDELAMMRGYSYDAIENMLEKRDANAGATAGIINYLAALIGPIPNLVATGEKATYITLYSFSSFCKVFYSFFLVYGIIFIVVNKKAEYMPLMVFFVLESAMLIFTRYTLHDRYQWPHIPITLMIAAYGAQVWKENKHFMKWREMYIVFAAAIILIYNFR